MTKRVKGWTEEEADRLVEEFRARGVSYKAIAKSLGRDWRTIKNAYERGIRPNKKTGFLGREPLRDVLAREQVEARASLATALPEPPSHETLESMREQVIRARVQTGILLAELKEATRSLSPGAQKLAEGCGAMFFKIGELLGDVEVVVRDAQENQISLASAMFAMKDVAQTLSVITSTVRELNDMERRELGEPTEIHGLAITMTDAEAVEKIKEAKAVFDFIDVDALEPPPMED